jgi:pathogenicity locus Cdd1 protein
MSVAQRRLEDLTSIGPAMLRDFEMLGIRSMAQLAKQSPRRMYARLNRISGQRQDPCLLDTFCAAVAQARNPRLPAEQCQWWYWSRKRKKGSQEVNRRQIRSKNGLETESTKKRNGRGRKKVNRVGPRMKRSTWKRKEN